MWVVDVFALGIRTGVLQDPSSYSTIFSDPFSDTPTIVNKLKDSQKATKKQGKKKSMYSHKKTISQPNRIAMASLVLLFRFNRTYYDLHKVIENIRKQTTLMKPHVTILLVPVQLMRWTALMAADSTIADWVSPVSVACFKPFSIAKASTSSTSPVK